MLPQIKKILYATDLSDNAKHAFNYAAILANKLDAKITIIHVIDEISTHSSSILVDLLGKEKWLAMKKEKEQDFKKIVQNRLEEFCDEVSEELQACPFIVEKSILKQGNPASVIIDESEKGYDAVVMGTHGHGILAGALMGNIARRVVRNCQIPVMVVPLPE